MSEASRRQTVLFTLLYASEGAPIGFIWWALPTVLRTAEVPIERITGLTAMLVLPWTFKFLWAPLVDRIRTARWGYRAWIATGQTAMAATLLPLAFLDPVVHFEVWMWLLVAHAVSAATQDVAIDALAIRVVSSAERGRLNGAMQAGMLTGRSLFGGGALLVVGVFGPRWMIGALVVWILTALGALLLLGEDEPPVGTGRTGRSVMADLAQLFRHRSTWWGLAFALIGAAGFEAAGQLAGPFLVDRGVSTGTIGVFFGVFVVVATIAGGLVGGRLSDRWGRVRACTVFLIAFVTVIVLLGLVDLSDAGGTTMRLALLTAVYFCVGLFTAASYALFMDLADPALGGTHFSLFMSATNGCEAWSAWAGGRVAGASGYPAAFIVMSLASLVGVPLLARLRPLIPSPVRRTSAPTSPL